MRALLFAEHLPGDDVRVVLHGRNDDLVACADELAPVAMHHEIDAFGGAADKDALLRLAGIDEALHLLARAFVSGGRFLAQVMNAAMNIGMFVFEINAATIDYHLRHLRGSSIVEIDQRLAVHRLAQHRKVCADALDIQPVAVAVVASL